MRKGLASVQRRSDIVLKTVENYWGFKIRDMVRITL